MKDQLEVQKAYDIINIEDSDTEELGQPTDLNGYIGEIRRNKEKL
jgi:hypothetical protein